MPTLAGPPIDAHHNWIYPPHPYMIMSLRIIAAGFSVSQNAMTGEACGIIGKQNV
jgi:hypothetical protein